MKKTMLRAGFAMAMAVTATFGLSACGSSDGGSGAAATSQAAEEAPKSNSDESEAFVADLEAGVKLINDQIAQESGMTQVMLASDVDQPTQKYGMWVLPYKPSEAVEKFTKQIQITDGTKFVVTAVSAETGKSWSMDQDGAMAEAEK
ncbi:MAG: hypothetical protein QM705_03705 [Ancrocorticia sp.]